MIKHLLTTTLLLTMTAAITSCMAADQKPAPKQSSKKAVLDLIDKAGLVESYRLEPIKRIPGARAIGRYSVIGNGPKLSQVQRQAAAVIIRKTLTDAKMGKINKNCEPLPGVALAFKSGKDLVEIAFCYDCQMWQFYLNGQRWQKWQHFDSGNKGLVKIAKALFPADKSIQGLRP